MELPVSVATDVLLSIMFRTVLNYEKLISGWWVTVVAEIKMQIDYLYFTLSARVHPMIVSVIFQSINILQVQIKYLYGRIWKRC